MTAEVHCRRCDGEAVQLMARGVPHLNSKPNACCLTIDPRGRAVRASFP